MMHANEFKYVDDRKTTKRVKLLLKKEKKRMDGAGNKWTARWVYRFLNRISRINVNQRYKWSNPERLKFLHATKESKTGGFSL